MWPHVMENSCERIQRNLLETRRSTVGGIDGSDMLSWHEVSSAVSSMARLWSIVCASERTHMNRCGMSPSETSLFKLLKRIFPQPSNLLVQFLSMAPSLGKFMSQLALLISGALQALVSTSKIGIYLFLFSREQTSLKCFGGSIGTCK